MTYLECFGWFCVAYVVVYALIFSFRREGGDESKTVR